MPSPDGVAVAGRSPSSSSTSTTSSGSTTPTATRPGDQILVRVAERLVGAVRAEDVVGRQSGDEFAVLLAHVRDADEAIVSADRILGELRRPILLGAHSIVVGGTIGIAVATEPGATAEDLLTQADAAMYAAKADGKGRHAVYDPWMPTRTWTELEAAG